MNLNREIIFAFLEEDNPKRAFFRVFPLFTVSGPVEQDFGDDGALRIIPDRNEQFVFKDRMRNIGLWCSIDLTSFPVSANKIRTNKNYNPARGERNQYIVFSDAIHDLTDMPFFEVLTGSPKEAGQLSSQAITPWFYIREGDVCYGPVEKRNPVQPTAPAEAPAGSVVTRACPDGLTHTILCTQQLEEQEAPEGAEAAPDGSTAAVQPESPEPSAAADAEAAPAAQPAGQQKAEEPAKEAPVLPLVPILSGQAAASTTSAGQEGKALLQDAAGKNTVRFTGTILQGSRRPAPVPTKDRVQESIHSKSHNGTNAEPLVAPVPFSTSLPRVENPVHQAIELLRRTWQQPENRGQLVNAMASLDGFQDCMRRHFYPDEKGDALFSITRLQIDDMELERIRTLVALRQAKEDLAAFRRSAVEQATAAARKKLEALQQDAEQIQQTLLTLQQEVNRQAKDADIPYRIGQTIPWDDLLSQLKATFDATGLPYVEEYARVWLAMLADPEAHIAVCSPSGEEGLECIKNCVASMGWTCADENTAPPKSELTTPVFHVVASLAEGTESRGRTIIVLDDTAGLEDSPMPVVAMTATRGQILEALAREAYSARSFTEASPQPTMLPEEAQTVLAPIFQNAGLNGEQLAAAARFASLATAYLDGSVQSACDWAIVLWVMPRICGKPVSDALRNQLQSYPHSASLLA